MQKEREIEKAGREYEEVKLMTGIKGIGVYSAHSSTNLGELSRLTG